MKEYVYISDKKVDMLFNQIPESRFKGMSIELGIDLKVLSAKVMRSDFELSRFEKLEIVLAELRRKELIGRLSQGLLFCADSLEMSWGPIDGKPGVTFFGGKKERLKIGLVGSSKHCLTAGSEEPWGGISDGPFYSYVLAQMLKGELEEDIHENLRTDLRRGTGSEKFTQSSLNSGLNVASYAIDSLGSTKFRVEFIASFKHSVVIKDHAFLLGTPLYVAFS